MTDKDAIVAHFMLVYDMRKDELENAVIRLRQDLQRERTDAERYRYLRDRAQRTEDGPSVVQGLSDLFEYLWGADVDEAVDEAIRDEKQPLSTGTAPE